MKLAEYKHKTYNFLGISEGGVQTCMHVPRLKLCFDIGRGSSRLVEVPTILLTHGHLDHSAGIPYHVSQRNLRRLPPADIYVPPEVERPLKEILRLWFEIEDFEATYNVHALDYDREYDLSGTLKFRAVRSVHRVPSNGYSIFERTRKLKPEFLNLPGPEIARLKKERDDMFYDAVVPHITFSGDTQIEFLLENEIVRQSKILFLECTFIDDKRPVERARQWGHIHLDEIVANAEALRDVERLYLIHFSPRYRRDFIDETLKKKMPDWLYEKTVPFLV